jgi:hypothetical protein
MMSGLVHFPLRRTAIRLAGRKCTASKNIKRLSICVTVDSLVDSLLLLFPEANLHEYNFVS